MQGPGPLHSDETCRKAKMSIEKTPTGSVDLLSLHDDGEFSFAYEVQDHNCVLLIDVLFWDMYHGRT